MPRVISKLPNAGQTVVTGKRQVQFTPDRGQMISEEIPEDVAARLASIPGYELVPDRTEPPQPQSTGGTASRGKGKGADGATQGAAGATQGAATAQGTGAAQGTGTADP